MFLQKEKKLSLIILESFFSGYFWFFDLRRINVVIYLFSELMRTAVVVQKLSSMQGMLVHVDTQGEGLG